MAISKLKKIFGIGPPGAVISIALLIMFWRINHNLGQFEITPFSSLMTYAAVIMGIIGVCIHLWTGWTLRNWWIKDRLCTQGPFKYVRHPMYAAWITFISSGLVLYLNSWIFLLWLAILHAMWHQLVKVEETMMRDVFGDEYQTYAAHTGRFVPRIFQKG